MTTLYVAAGGGGDAIAAALLHQADPDGAPPVIATYAWDRLIVDPLPGPRGAECFTGLDRAGSHVYVVNSRTRPVPPSGSTLPRLAAQLAATLVLLDPTRATVGMAAQLRDAVAVFGVERVFVVDVGGDVLARGDEPGLRSPLADALCLAACVDLPVPVEVLAAGLGLDGELPPGYAHERAAEIGGAADFPPLAPHVGTVLPVLDWHPSESSTLLAGALLGRRGVVEVRDAGAQVVLDERATRVYRLPLGAVTQAGLLAQRLRGAGSLGEAEDAARAVCGFSEIDYERRKAAAITASPRSPVAADQFREAVARFHAAAAGRGSDYATFRRVAEALGTPAGGFEQLRTILLRSWPDRFAAPLWRVRDAS